MLLLYTTYSSSCCSCFSIQQCRQPLNRCYSLRFSFVFTWHGYTMRWCFDCLWLQQTRAPLLACYHRSRSRSIKDYQNLVDHSVGTTSVSRRYIICQPPDDIGTETNTAAGCLYGLLYTHKKCNPLPPCLRSFLPATSVFFTTRRYPAHPISVLILYPTSREIQALWLQTTTQR